MKIVDIKHSQDGITTKYVQSVDGHSIETTYVDYANKHIICYSTQVGCKNRCSFCRNGIANNFIRNLSAEEIFEQIENVLGQINVSDTKPLLFSAMGIGEPLSNCDNYISSVDMLYRKYPTSKFALSTSGSNVDGIVQLLTWWKNGGKNTSLELMISVHSVVPETRSLLMPSSIGIGAILLATRYAKTFGVDTEYNITLIDGINDSVSDALALARQFSVYHMNGTAKIKINRFNTIPNCEFRPSITVGSFINSLRSYGVSDIEYYETNGIDICTGCGQMLSEELG